uniref:Uncharacterized protein n=1 Tax=Anguilla anguilla TaxID=7936 RepID=A0A0E9QJ87_ANGAN
MQVAFSFQLPIGMIFIYCCCTENSQAAMNSFQLQLLLRVK